MVDKGVLLFDVYSASGILYQTRERLTKIISPFSRLFFDLGFRTRMDHDYLCLQTKIQKLTNFPRVRGNRGNSLTQIIPNKYK